jgi:hypothetical protein
MRDWSEDAQYHRAIRDAATPPRVRKHIGETENERLHRYRRNMLVTFIVIIVIVLAVLVGAACLALIY